APGRGGSSNCSHAAEGGGGSGGSPVDPESSGPGPVVSPSSPLVVVADVPGAVVVAVPLPSATLVSPSSASSEPVPQAEAVKTAASPSAATRHGWTRACKRRSSMRGRYYRRPDGAWGRATSIEVGSSPRSSPTAAAPTPDRSSARRPRTGCCPP